MDSPFRHSFSGLRLGVGLLSWFAPDLAARVFALTPPPEPFVTRLFGARETTMALGLQAASPPVRRAAIQAGIGIDLADALGGFVDHGRGRLPRRATVLGPGGALVFAALGVATLREHDRAFPRGS